MSAWDTVPTPKEITEYPEEEWTEYMQSVYRSLGHWWIENRFHDQDGFFAEYAGSEKCLALGHVPPADPSDWETVLDHGLGWSGEVLCDGTRYGIACTHCEGECSHERPPLVWTLPGVIGASRV